MKSAESSVPNQTKSAESSVPNQTKSAESSVSSQTKSAVSNGPNQIKSAESGVPSQTKSAESSAETQTKSAGSSVPNQTKKAESYVSNQTKSAESDDLPEPVGTSVSAEILSGESEEADRLKLPHVVKAEGGISFEKDVLLERGVPLEEGDISGLSWVAFRSQYFRKWMINWSRNKRP